MRVENWELGGNSAPGPRRVRARGPAARDGPQWRTLHHYGLTLKPTVFVAKYDDIGPFDYAGALDHQLGSLDQQSCGCQHDNDLLTEEDCSLVVQTPNVALGLRVRICRAFVHPRVGPESSLAAWLSAGTGEVSFANVTIMTEVVGDTGGAAGNLSKNRERALKPQGRASQPDPRERADPSRGICHA